jgi:hypothetical protein
MPENMRDVYSLEARVTALETANLNVNKKLDENTKLTKQVSEDTSEMLAIFKNVKLAVKFFSVVGTILKWFGAICAAVISIVALWSVAKSGLPR